VDTVAHFRPDPALVASLRAIAADPADIKEFPCRAPGEVPLSWVRPGYLA